jgi:hypothetical protein
MTGPRMTCAGLRGIGPGLGHRTRYARELPRRSKHAAQRVAPVCRTDSVGEGEELALRADAGRCSCQEIANLCRANERSEGYGDGMCHRDRARLAATCAAGIRRVTRLRK